MVPDVSTGVTRETPSRRSRAATRSASTGRVTVASRSTADATRSAAVSGSTSRRCTEATSSASDVSWAIARSIAERARAVAAVDHLAGEVAAAALLQPSVGSERVSALDDRAPEPVDALAPNGLGEDDRRAPGGVGVEGDHTPDVVLQRLRTRLIHLVDRDHVRDLHDRERRVDQPRVQRHEVRRRELSRSRTGNGKLVTNTSAVATSRCSTAIPSLCFRSIAKLRLLREVSCQ